MTDLSDKEKRLLTLAMGIISLENIILSPLVDDSNARECEDTLSTAKKNYDQLFSEVDQDALRAKLASPLDPPSNTLADDLKARLG